MEKVLEIVKRAQDELRSILQKAAGQEGGFSKDQYARYLSMQYHLTMGVQRHFYAAASHETMATKRSLRKFLVKFANEEEPHYLIAQKDLEELGYEPSTEPIDVKLWKAFFGPIASERPFVRLGATCVLENIANGSSDLLDRILATAPFITEKNIRFLTIHRHEDNLAHGDQIVEALSNVDLSDQDLEDLVEGASIGRLMFLRLIQWALSGEESFAA